MEFVIESLELILEYITQLGILLFEYDRCFLYLWLNEIFKT